MASLVDTNILVYSFDPRDPAKQRTANEILRNGLLANSVVLAHQSIVEFVAAIARPRRDLGGLPLLSFEQARLEAEQLLVQFPVVYPERNVVVAALRATAMYGLSWFDAHLWAYAEVNGISEILSEDFEHGRHYGGVRIVNPFLLSDEIHELPALYDVGVPKPIRRNRARARDRSPLPR